MATKKLKDIGTLSEPEKGSLRKQILKELEKTENRELSVYELQ